MPAREREGMTNVPADERLQHEFGNDSGHRWGKKGKRRGTPPTPDDTDRRDAEAQHRDGAGVAELDEIPQQVMVAGEPKLDSSIEVAVDPPSTISVGVMRPEHRSHEGAYD